MSGQRSQAKITSDSGFVTSKGHAMIERSAPTQFICFNVVKGKIPACSLNTSEQVLGRTGTTLAVSRSRSSEVHGLCSEETQLSAGCN